MGDRRDGHSRRGHERLHDDNRDRRRDRDRARDRDDDSGRPRDRSRDHGRDRHRDSDRRRYRSRSRDRLDRRRSRSPGRERGYARRDADGDREKDRQLRRREDERAEPRRERGDRSVRREGPSPAKDQPGSDKDRGRDGRTATASPRRSVSPRLAFERDTDEHPQLPTRSKSGSTSAPGATHGATLSFKVKGRDGSHGPEPRHQSTSTRENSQELPQQYNDDGDRQQLRGRFDADPMDENEPEEVVVEDDGLDDMAAMMGFGGFGSTKGKKVLGNNVGAARKEKKTQYRQYMNRVGGFNRPLSPTR